jgi:hypothetical protein
MAGGLKEGATPKSIEISRRVKNSDRNASNAVSAQIFNVDVDDILEMLPTRSYYNLLT